MVRPPHMIRNFRMVLAVGQVTPFGRDSPDPEVQQKET